MSQVLDRKLLTDLVLATLAPGTYPIGDAGPPDLPVDPALRHAGWNGQPNAPGSFYVPYAILTPGSISNTSGPLSDPQGDAQVPYTLAYYGVNRGQVELLGGKLRTLLLGLRDQRFISADHNHKIQQVWFSVIGGVGRVEATDPPTFGAIDTLTIWVTK